MTPAGALSPPEFVGHVRNVQVLWGKTPGLVKMLVAFGCRHNLFGLLSVWDSQGEERKQGTPRWQSWPTAIFSSLQKIPSPNLTLASPDLEWTPVPKGCYLPPGKSQEPYISLCYNIWEENGENLVWGKESWKYLESAITIRIGLQPTVNSSLVVNYQLAQRSNLQVLRVCGSQWSVLLAVL